MSNIVAFRERVMEQIRTKITDVKEVEWYDGMFDEDDVIEWALKTPACMVSVINAPTTPHSTGELNASLKVIVVTIVQDRTVPRDADAVCWKIIEDIAVLAHNHQFGDPNAGVSEKIAFKRLSVPAMRREGVALGITEWMTTLTMGVNEVKKREFFYNPATGEEITQLPETLTGEGSVIDVAGNQSAREILGLAPEEE